MDSNFGAFGTAVALGSVAVEAAVVPLWDRARSRSRQRSSEEALPRAGAVTEGIGMLAAELGGAIAALAGFAILPTAWLGCECGGRSVPTEPIEFGRETPPA